MADDGHVDNTLLFAVNPEERVHLFIVESSDLACSKVEGDCGESEILGDVSGVEINVTVGSLVVFPL